ncbi:MAG: hypothetical protein IPJ49_21530 [Candidatus Obscuribacter sp.]|nr:hypothetical protein [Candidatus Obscuribacter sp.]
MNQEPKSSKNPLVKLFELLIKGVMGFFMVFYLLWKNTAEPLHKEAYEGRPFGQFIGRVLALCRLCLALLCTGTAGRYLGVCDSLSGSRTDL